MYADIDFDRLEKEYPDIQEQNSIMRTIIMRLQGEQFPDLDPEDTENADSFLNQID